MHQRPEEEQLREEEQRREEIARLLADGLATETEPFPQTHVEFSQILDALRKVPADDIRTKLIISGFTNKPEGPEQMRCLECIYYLVHRRWCDLPELDVPAERDWYCRLWRI